MCETGRTGKSAYRTTRCLSRNPPGVPVLHVKVCYATCVAVSFSLSSCLDRISQQSHKSAPTMWPEYFVNVHKLPTSVTPSLRSRAGSEPMRFAQGKLREGLARWA